MRIQYADTVKVNHDASLIEKVDNLSQSIENDFNELQIADSIKLSDCVSSIILDGTNLGKKNIPIEDADVYVQFQMLHKEFNSRIEGIEGCPWAVVEKYLKEHKIEELEHLKELVFYNLRRLETTSRNDESIDPQLKPYLDKVQNILNQRQRNYEELGNFNRKSKEIRIYYNLLQKYNGSLDESLASVLAHELFHAFHCFISDVYTKRGYKAKIVREASADFFAFNYLDKHDYENAYKSLFDKWDKDLLSTDPYAKAWFFFFRDIGFRSAPDSIDCEAMDRFKSIVGFSKTSMDNAYEELIPEQYRNYCHTSKQTKRKKNNQLEGVFERNRDLLRDFGINSPRGIEKQLIELNEDQWGELQSKLSNADRAFVSQKRVMINGIHPKCIKVTLTWEHSAFFSSMEDCLQNAKMEFDRANDEVTFCGISKNGVRTTICSPLDGKFVDTFFSVAEDSYHEDLDLTRGIIYDIHIVHIKCDFSDHTYSELQGITPNYYPYNKLYKKARMLIKQLKAPLNDFANGKLEDI